MKLAIVPVEATDGMLAAPHESLGLLPPAECLREEYLAMLSASPNGGKVTEEMVEAAAMIMMNVYLHYMPKPDRDLSDIFDKMARAAFRAIGLEVE